MFLSRLKRLNWRESAKPENFDLHGHKAGTCTSGGVLMVAALGISSYMVLGEQHSLATTLIFSVVLFGLVGFLDDFRKVKIGKGLSKLTKLSMLIIVSVISILLLPEYQTLSFSNVLFALFVLVGTTNAVNLTDGVDGLATSVSIVVLMTFLLAMFGVSNWLGYGHFTHSELSTLIVITACAIGSCIGFLVFNRNPAKLFMGDTGSLALGGLIALLSLQSNSPYLLAVIGIIYVVEALSVIIQVSVFKFRGNRVFKRAPIHHHYEMSGFTENQIVLSFTLISAYAGVLVLLV